MCIQIDWYTHRCIYGTTIMQCSKLSRPKSFALCLVTPDRGHYQRALQGLISDKQKRSKEKHDGEVCRCWWSISYRDIRKYNIKGIELRFRVYIGRNSLNRHRESRPKVFVIFTIDECIDTFTSHNIMHNLTHTYALNFLRFI